MSFDYYQSVIGKMRKGTADDSFIDVNETLQVVNSKVVLSEIPDKFNGLVVKTVFGNTTLVEIKKGTPTDNQYLCDYNLGVVHFPDTVNNERYVFSYKGRGAVYLAAERIYTKQMNSEEIIQTLRDVLDEADSIINLSERFTNKGTYSSSTVYYGRNIVTYDNAAYMCINHSADGIINIPPTNTTHWMQMVSVKQAIEVANAAASSANTAATNANTATTNANNAADYANEQGDYAKGIRDNFGHKGDYSPTATYKNGNVVTYGGINYFCIQDTTAGIDPLNGAYWTVVSPQASINDQTWTATEGQTIFNITNGNYVPSQGNIEVWVGGVPQVSGVGYTETNNTTITLSEGVTAGTTVFAKWYEGTMTITKGHKSSHNLGGQDEIDLTQLKNYKEKVSDEFFRVDAQLAEKATLADVKSKVGFADINKNLSQIDETMLSDTLKQQMAGTTPVNATPPDGGVTTIKLANKSVTEDKTDLFKSSLNGINKFLDDKITSKKIGYSDLTNVSTTGGYTTDRILYGKTTAGAAFSAMYLQTNQAIEFELLKINYLFFAKDDTHFYGVNLGDVVNGNFGYVFKFSIAANAATLVKSNTGFDLTKFAKPNDIVEAKKVDNKLVFRIKRTGTTDFVDWFTYDLTTLNLPTVTYLWGFSTRYDITTNVLKNLETQDIKYAEKEKQIESRLSTAESEITTLKNSVNPDSTVYVKSNLKDKKWLSVGDSITLAGKYQTKAQELLGIGTVYNKGINGSPIDGFATRLSNYPDEFPLDSDIITVFGGTNDFHLDYTLGEVGQQATTANSLDWLLRQLIDRFPTKTIAVITPLQRWGYTSSSINGGNPTTMTNNLGITLEQYANKIKQIANGYGIPVLDLYHESGFNPRNINSLTSDGLHPNDFGYAKIGQQIAMFMNKL